MATPSFVAAGAGATGTGSSLAAPAVSGLSGGEKLVLHVLSLGTETIPAAPSGWTLVVTRTAAGAPNLNIWVYQRTAVAAAGSDGGVTVDFSGSADRKAVRVYALASVGLLAAAAPSATNYTTGTATTVTAADVSLGGPNAIALSLLSIAAERTVASFTGETGGDWTEAVGEYSPGGLGFTMQVQSSAFTASDIAGGTLTISSGALWVCQPLYVVGTTEYGRHSPPRNPSRVTAPEPGTIAATRDLSTIPDMSPHGKEVTGAEAIAERLLDRLTTTRGTYPWWPNYGTNIKEFLLGKAPLWRIENAAKVECEKDEQVESAIVNATLSADLTNIRLAIFFTTAVGTFEFTMTVNEASANYIALSKAA